LTSEQRAALKAEFDRMDAERKRLEAHQPRLKLTDSAGKLATQLYVSASQASAHDAAEADAQRILEALESDEELRQWFDSPLTSKDQAQERLEPLGTRLQLSPAVRSFLLDLAEQGRLRDFRSIAKKYEVLLTDARREVPVTVIAPTVRRAQAVAASEKFQAAMRQFLKEGESLKFVYRTDPTLLDGYQVEVAGYAADFSFKTALAGERKKLERERPEPLDFKLARLREIRPLVTEEEGAKFASLLKALPLSSYMKVDQVYGKPPAA
jgi:F-type H+-transporting ATPase subunit O